MRDREWMRERGKLDGLDSGVLSLSDALLFFLVILGVGKSAMTIVRFSRADRIKGAKTTNRAGRPKEAGEVRTVQNAKVDGSSEKGRKEKEKEKVEEEGGERGRDKMGRKQTEPSPGKNPNESENEGPRDEDEENRPRPDHR